MLPCATASRLVGGFKGGALQILLVLLLVRLVAVRGDRLGRLVLRYSAATLLTLAAMYAVTSSYSTVRARAASGSESVVDQLVTRARSEKSAAAPAAPAVAKK